MQVQDEQTQDDFIRALQRQVDELTTANMLLQEQLARKEQFTAMIAHELRGPLTPIISYAQMISRPDQRSEAIKRGTGIIISQAKRLTRLTSDLLDSTHISTGQFTLIREQCDVVTLAQEIVEQLRPLAPYHTFIMQAPDTPLIGNWDAGRLQQALGNLLDNAIKYSADGTTITVRIWYTTNTIHISVHNQGTSIPSAEIAQLFRPYVRLQPTSTRRGSGLGLHITKCIVEAHGGTLRLEPHTDESQSEQGTTFTFELPCSL
jgi:signal transduction histidine kinase